MDQENIFRGYILSREHRESNGRHRLVYTGISDRGPFSIAITDNRPLFFVRRDAVLPEGFVDGRRHRVDLADFEGHPVDALYFDTQRQLSWARQHLESAGIRTYEADIRPEERYLMERFIHGSVVFEGPPAPVGPPFQFTDVRMQNGDFRPEFSILSLDIETGQTGELYSIACHFKGADTANGHPASAGFVEHMLVLMRDPGVGEGYLPPASERPGSTGGSEAALKGSVFMGLPGERLPAGGWMVRFPGEKDLLEAFLVVMKNLDPDVIIGWHVIGFDLLFLEKRFRRYNLPFSIGRFGRIARVWEVRKGVFRADICGRVVIDGPPGLRAAFYRFDNFRLETVAAAVLGHGKTIDEETDKVAEIERRFQEDKTSLAHYNLEDCRLVSDVFSKTGLIDLTFERAMLSGLPMDRVGMSVAAFEFFMLPRMHRHGHVASNVQDVDSKGSAAGGWVFVKAPGFYEHVAVFDFKSLYPSIIRTFKIDPLSRLKAHESPLYTPVGIPFSRTEHVLPALVSKLIARRELAKRDGDPHLSQAIKILMNSFYGVMGTPGCRFYDHRLPAAITGTGQWVLKQTREHLETLGYSVLYGDTDSVFVRLKQEEWHDAHAAAGRLVQNINIFVADKVRKEFGVESRLEIEFERHFERLFLPSLRGGGEGAKKRYVGMVHGEEKDELVFTGLEFVRSDWTRFARNFQYELFDRIFHEREVEGWIRTVAADLRNRVYDGDLIYTKHLRKSPGDYIKGVPPHVKAARMLGKAAEGIREIRYVVTRRGPVPAALPHGDLDYGHYIDKQLKPIADAVLQFFDRSVDDILGGRQLELF
ncbi:MAG: DNA polymerase II [Deltaproteobacteria bacterium]|nr:DNA polymerase II [Deltaproteobacteria bacterium]